MNQDSMNARIEVWFAQIAKLRLDMNHFMERSVRQNDAPASDLYHNFGNALEALAVALDHLSEMLGDEPEIISDPNWMMPTIEEVRHHREVTGEGMFTSKERLIRSRIKDALPQIMETKDFTKLTQVVEYLVSHKT